MANYNANHLPTLAQLQMALTRCQAKISEVLTASSSAITAVANAKADKNHTHSKAEIVAALGFTPASGNITASGTNYVRFSDGTQICWACYDTQQNNPVTWTFPVPFANASYAFVAQAKRGTVLSDITTKAAASIVYNFKTNASAHYTFAIGRWA